MLSYQHSYHAGNLADVHKHAFLASALDYLTRKDKPLGYFETHAGRGLYALDSAQARKTGEAATGIGRAEPAFPADHPYIRALTDFRRLHGQMAYPGSPMIAAACLRPIDRIALAELHPQEYAALETNMRGTGALCRHQDGFDFAMSVTPPTPRRGLILIDPSYEIKSDYAALPAFLNRLHRRWNVGVLALWYPILRNGAHLPMLMELEAASLPDPMRHEVHFAPQRDGHGLIGSGMFIVNAPYGLNVEARRLTQILQPFCAPQTGAEDHRH